MLNHASLISYHKVRDNFYFNEYPLCLNLVCALCTASLYLSTFCFYLEKYKHFSKKICYNLCVLKNVKNRRKFMEQLFSITPLQVGQLVNKIELGELGLPELQRPFIWTDSKVRDLFDSMMKG